MFEGLAHFHRRVRIHEKHEPYPHPSKYKRLLDDAAYLVGLASALFIIPQVWDVFASGTAAGVSVVSWTAFAIASLFWFAYGIAHKEKPLILTFSIAFVLQLLVVIGTLLYQ